MQPRGRLQWRGAACAGMRPCKRALLLCQEAPRAADYEAGKPAASPSLPGEPRCGALRALVAVCIFIVGAGARAGAGEQQQGGLSGRSQGGVDRAQDCYS
jgi:hypothetical protein